MKLLEAVKSTDNIQLDKKTLVILRWIATKYLCVFNADYSFQPKDLIKMLELNSSGNDFVFASRYIKNAGSDDDTFVTLFGNYFFWRFYQHFFAV